MNDIIYNKLYEKNLIVVNNNENTEWEPVAVLLFEKCNVSIQGKIKNITIGDVKRLMTFLGANTAEPFYKHFPTSVMNMSDYEMILDRFMSYLIAYGTDLPDDVKDSIASHSLLEKKGIDDKRDVELQRSVDTKKLFKCITEDDAKHTVIPKIVNELLSTTRPLSINDYEFLLDTLKSDLVKITPDVKIRSKSTLANLFIDLDFPTQILGSNFTSINDVLKIIDILEIRLENKGNCPRKRLTKLKFTNKYGKKILKLIEYIINCNGDNINCVLEQMCEKKKIWIGILNRLHVGGATGSEKLRYINRIIRLKPQSENEKLVIDDTVISTNTVPRSVESWFNKYMNDKNTTSLYIAHYLMEKKGATYVLRKIALLISKCIDFKEFTDLIEYIIPEVRNTLILWQLLRVLPNMIDPEERVFTYIVDNKVVQYKEDTERSLRRRTVLNRVHITYLRNAIHKQLNRLYKNINIGKVYIDNPERLEMTALPLSNATGSITTNYLPTGTRIPIDSKAKYIRVFTSWKKIDDLDISAKIITNTDKTVDAYWNSYTNSFKENGIIFSGDETRGYYGGVEYYDLHLEKMRNAGYRYIVIYSVIYSAYTRASNTHKRATYNDIEAYGGYMIRDSYNDKEVLSEIDRRISYEEIYDIKTVAQRFNITGSCRMSMTMAVDIANNEIIWLNEPLNNNGSVITNVELTSSFFDKYLNMTKEINLLTFANILSTEIVTTIDEADTIITYNNNFDFSKLTNDDNKLNSVQIIRPNDYETILKLIDSTHVTQ